MVQNVLPDVLFGLMNEMDNLYYNPSCYEMHQVMAPSAWDDAHDVDYSLSHYSLLRYKYDDGAL